jgi:hypothetical protein
MLVKEYAEQEKEKKIFSNNKTEKKSKALRCGWW